MNHEYMISDKFIPGRLRTWFAYDGDYIGHLKVGQNHEVFAYIAGHTECRFEGSVINTSNMRGISPHYLKRLQENMEKVKWTKSPELELTNYPVSEENSKTGIGALNSTLELKRHLGRKLYRLIHNKEYNVPISEAERKEIDELSVYQLVTINVTSTSSRAEFLRELKGNGELLNSLTMLEVNVFEYKNRLILEVGFSTDNEHVFNDVVDLVINSANLQAPIAERPEIWHQPNIIR